MFLRCKKRRKDGKEHHYWSIVENRRIMGGRVLQRHVLYIGELNGCQEASWRKTVELFGQDQTAPQQVSLFPESRLPDHSDSPIPNIGIRISQMRLECPRQWGACWLSCELWQQLGLDEFWREKLPVGRQGARWDQILQTLVLYRLIDPGSEWRLHRHWFEHSALPDLLGSDFSLAEIHRLYECHNKILEHKTALFDHLTERWRTLFDAKFEVLLYDLTSTYFESNPPEDPADIRRRRLRKYLKALADLTGRKRPLKRDELHQALGAAKKEAGRDSRHVKVEVTLHGEGKAQTAILTYRIDRQKLRIARRREGRYLLRANMTNTDPVKLWEYYLQLTEIEQAFKELKGDLAIRPIDHQLENRIEAHIFISFLSYCLQVTLKARRIHQMTMKIFDRSIGTD